MFWEHLHAKHDDCWNGLNNNKNEVCQLQLIGGKQNNPNGGYEAANHV